MTVELVAEQPLNSYDTPKRRRNRPADPLFAAYLDGREVRWQAGYERDIAAAGNDPRLRLLALFETLRTCTADPALADCTFAGFSAGSAGPFSRRIITRHENTLRDRLTELATEAGVPEPAALAGHLLMLFRTAALMHRAGTRPAAVAEAALTAERVVDSYLTAREA